ncbi:MAG TPA: YidB family protein [Burkholderiales bacterium]|jgi:uncharacterized protein YidB (DUF937 family)|nr:YidB family protein [Burkholderiales bacterium]
MALLDDLLGGMLGGAMGQQGEQPMGRGQPPAQANAGGGMGSIMMALLPVVLSMLASRGGGASQGGGGLGDLLGQVLGGGAQQGGMGGMGGFGSLLEQLQRSGYGDQARSWVGTGQNMPIPPDAMEQIFGRGGLAEIARQAGVSEADASRGLSELLPEVVDRVTPNGEVPDLDSLAASVNDLSRRLGVA